MKVLVTLRRTNCLFNYNQQLLKTCPVKEVILNNLKADSSIVDESTQYTNRNSMMALKPQSSSLSKTRNRILSEKRTSKKTIDKLKLNNPEQKRYSSDFIPTIDLRKKIQPKKIKK